MVSWPPKAVTLVEGSDFAAQCDSLDPSRTTLDRVLEGVSWAIARNPDYFPRVPGTVISVAQVIDTPLLPALVILFRRLDRDRCELLAILEDIDG